MNSSSSQNRQTCKKHFNNSSTCLAYSVFTCPQKEDGLIKIYSQYHKAMARLATGSKQHKTQQALALCFPHWAIQVSYKWNNTYQFHPSWSHPDNGTSQGHRQRIYHHPQKSPEGRKSGEDEKVSLSYSTKTNLISNVYCPQWYCT